MSIITRVSASYSLKESPASFNFLEFLVAATTYGASHIVIDPESAKKFKGLELEERIHSILIPACQLLGCSYEFGKVRGLTPGHHMSAVLRAFKHKGFIRKFESQVFGNFRYTVTLRNYSRHPERNSNDSWRAFAKEIKAKVIEDYYDEPITLKERLFLYAGARMNFFGQNGPLALCLFSDYPYTAFIPAEGRWETYHKEHGWYKTQLPWAKDNQRILWEPFSCEKAISLTS